jgi:hypothetical protein
MPKSMLNAPVLKAVINDISKNTLALGEMFLKNSLLLRH